MEHKDYETIHPGTFVTRSILNNLGSPDDSLKIIHIAGTNGKGSTAEYFTEILISAGKKVGTFTSPAVYDFYDQFCIDGKPMSEDIAEKYFDRAFKAAEGLNATDFEIQTAGILLAFKEEGCEYAVIECGMGGLNDATNAINKKQLAVITSISLEHTAYLGNTVEEICAQKAGIIKNCPVIVNAHQCGESRRFFRSYKFADKMGEISDGAFIYDGKRFELKPNGVLQPHNAACAIEGAKILGLPEEAIREGIKNTRLYGRVEEIKADGKTYILDGAHNRAAFKPLKQYLCSQDCKRTVIFGCLKDKDIDEILSQIVANEIIAVSCQSPRARTLEDTFAHCRKQFGKRARMAESVTQALDMADGEVVAVCGSFTLLKEAKQWIEKKL